MKSAKLICTTAMTLLVALAIPVARAAQSQPQKPRRARYRITDLGTLGGTFSKAGGISNSGWVEGYSTLPGDSTFHEFLWRKGTMTDLGTLGGANSFSESRPNDRGDAGGYSETSTPDPDGEDFCGFGNQVICLGFLWHDGLLTAQPTLGGNNDAGFGTNNRGELVGTAENTTPEPTCEGTGQIFQYKPVVWKKGRVHELPTFGDDPVGIAYAINEWGRAVGQTGPCGVEAFGSTSRAVLWKKGKAIDLGDLGGSLNNIAEDINNQGQVVGLSDLGGDQVFHGFLWSRGVMTDLGVLPGKIYSNGEAINSEGQVVGASADASFNGTGWVWEKGVMTDLNTLIPANSPLYIVNATCNNDRGQIVGSAIEIGTGEEHAFLLTPRDGEDDGDDDATSAAAENVQRPNVILPEKMRKLLGRPGRRITPR